MKSQLQDLRAREMQTRHKTKEQLMIEFLKRKYNKNGEYSEQ